MFTVETIFLFAEIIGVASAAVSGVLSAARERLDLFGAMVLGCVTAVGGGIIRDLLLGVTPPAAFQSSLYISVAAGVSLACFFIEYFFGNDLSRRFSSYKQRYEQLLNVFDAIGLSVFVVVGVDAAYAAGYADNAFLTIFVGTITGVGGGILRDVMIGKTPVVLQKRIYCIAAIAGAWLDVLLRDFRCISTLASLLAVALILLIRFLATHYRWNLPRYPRT